MDEVMRKLDRLEHASATQRTPHYRIHEMPSGAKSISLETAAFRGRIIGDTSGVTSNRNKTISRICGYA